jgi:hypothetical protein
MRIGLLYSGDDEARIHGSAITTYYLKEALESQGHDVWRWSVTCGTALPHDLIRATSMVIAEGIYHSDIPTDIWLACDCVILWHLSKMFYGADELLSAPFHAVATNSHAVWTRLSNSGRVCAYIELAAPTSFTSAIPQDRYQALAVYLGCYPHKSERQLSLLLRPTSSLDLSIWGYGWQESQYKKCHRGVLPFHDIGALYKSADAVLALTEERQKVLGMINNRIYEALAAGAVVISEPYPALANHELGEFITFASAEKDVMDALLEVRDMRESRLRNSQAQKVILERHTYDDRARKFLMLYKATR